MKNKNVIIIGALAILLIVFVVAVIAFKGGGDATSETSTEASTVATELSTVEVVSATTEEAKTEESTKASKKKKKKKKSKKTTEATTEEITEAADDHTSDIDPESDKPNNNKPQDNNKPDNYSNNNDGYQVDEQSEPLTFRNKRRLDEHYEKHGKDMGFKDAEEYQEAASNVVNNPNALHKIEKEDGDDVYYVEDTNEFVVVSTDGYIRTYFNPDGGIDYYKRQ